METEWSDYEDQILRITVDEQGYDDFQYVSEEVFKGTRSYDQCKNRWKDVSGTAYAAHIL